MNATNTCIRRLHSCQSKSLKIVKKASRIIHSCYFFSMNRSRESSVSKETSSIWKTAEASNPSSSSRTNRLSFSRFTPEPVERSFVMFVHGTESRKPSVKDVEKKRPSLTGNSTDSPFQRRPTASSYFYSSPSRPYQESYLVRRTSSTGNVNNRTEIIPVRPSPPPSSPVASSASSSRQAAGGDKNQFYTDKHFSSKFLNDSIPLSQMIVSKK